MKIRLLLLFLVASFCGFSQDYFPTNSGVKTTASHYQAIINATLHPSPNKVIERGTLLFKAGRIVAMGKEISLPKNTQIYDFSGKHLYASFIELQSNFGLPSKSNNNRRRGRSTQYESSREGYYWNDHMISDYNSIEDYSYKKADAASYRKAGFGVVNAHRAEGIHRGTSVLIALNDQENDAQRLLDERVAQHYSFTKSSLSGQYYPGSIMGAMALLRQFFHDAEWYKKGGAKNIDLALQAHIDNTGLPAIFEAKNKLDVARAAKIGKEFKLPFIITASGKEYEHLSSLKALNARLLVPVNFPKAYDVTDPVSTQKIALSDMRYWNQAPANPAKVAAAGIPFALTTYGLSNKSNFLTHLRKAVAYGLNKSEALAALTTVPAKMLKKGKLLGQLKKGALANFIVTDGPLFIDATKIEENWVQGSRHKIIQKEDINIDGKYTLMMQENQLSLEIKNSQSKIAATVKMDSVKLKAKTSYKDGWISLQLQNSEKAYAQLSGKITNPKHIKGTGTSFDGKSISWMAHFKEAVEEKKKEAKEKNYPPTVAVTYPNNGFGFTQLPQKQNVIFKNATVWTNESEGILEKTDVWVENGKIKAVGQNLSAQNVEEIDATGKHLTSGIIDEHSHIGASSINEGGHNSSAEVTIEDVINPDDINLYRNLSGGVTTLQILHGSANPIGGRSAIIKPRWGESAENLLYKGADPFIKFALGENVKQSNWPSYNRFPQTRMGVEQVFVDYFQRAKEYQESWAKYNALPRKTKAKTLAPRYDIEMETLVEILEGKRFISCHSYVQSEINMLMKVAERFGVTINTFTHILEGYKVADKMKEHGVGGSTFSDWWAYKFEVNDAIPYNGAIMHSQGVTVAFNSDDSEMSRRLNQEAAKAVKYGGVSEEEAWKFVTLNPAKLLHIDDQVGSIKVGKSADLVLWNNHPMSIYAVAEMTMIEGIFYYEIDRATAQVNKIQLERNQLIQQMVSAKNGGAPTKKAPRKQAREFHCETLD